MMPRRRRTGTLVLSTLALVVLLVVVGYGLYLANMAGRLPWQEVPTRIPVTPFANLGGADDADEDESAPGTPVSAVPQWTLGTFAAADSPTMA